MDPTRWDHTVWEQSFEKRRKRESRFGMAACASLGVLALSDEPNRTVGVFVLCDEGVLRRQRVLGGGPPPFEFGVDAEVDMNCFHLAFTVPTTSDAQALLLVSDPGQATVHIVDVVANRHLGYLGVHGALDDAGGVACARGRAAVACGKQLHMFKGDGTTWSPLWTREHEASDWRTLVRFSHDGTEALVFSSQEQLPAVVAYDVGTGALLSRTVPTAYLLHSRGFDVCDCGGWLFLTAGDDRVLYVAEPKGPTPVKVELLRSSSKLGALAMVPGAGVVARPRGTVFNRGQIMEKVLIRETPTMRAQAAMSDLRVAWIVAVARGVLDRGRQRLNVGSVVQSKRLKLRR
jgi:hypothetical protein